jgi:EAL domain-containing protein (putative c-di-GMP-specific phosphodiesterase class I)
MVCRARGIKIIAEYIHSKEVQDEVDKLGIDYSQGFYFGEPSPELVEQ